jgi:hypothetical protein
MEALSFKPCLRLLLDHFSTIRDVRQACKVAFPLREILLLVNRRSGQKALHLVSAFANVWALASRMV